MKGLIKTIGIGIAAVGLAGSPLEAEAHWPAHHSHVHVPPIPIFAPPIPIFAPPFVRQRTITTTTTTTHTYSYNIAPPVVSAPPASVYVPPQVIVQPPTIIIQPRPYTVIVP